jgi:hypothetical protein
MAWRSRRSSFPASPFNRGASPPRPPGFIALLPSQRAERRRPSSRVSGADIIAGARPSEREDPLPARRTSVRRIKEVLRLRYELKLDQRQIARSCSLLSVPYMSI